MNARVIEDAKCMEQAHLAVAGGDGRAIRLRAGLTLEDLAKLVGAAFTSVGNWERADTYPTVEHAIRYGRVLRKLQGEGSEHG